MTKEEKQKQRLELWQSRLSRALCAYSAELEAMDGRVRLFRGDNTVSAVFEGDSDTVTPLVRNVIAENIESCINSSVPAPKVTALRSSDAHLARIIEQMLYAEIDRLPAEELNDTDERLCPIHGASFFHVEWDSAEGEVELSQLGANMVIPGAGMWGDVDSMEYYFLRVPRTKGYIRRRYGVDAAEESEQFPELRGDDADSSEEHVTQIYAYYRNDNGGVGLFSFAGSCVLCDEEDYYSKRERVCKSCHAPFDPVEGGDGNSCPECGCTQYEYARSEYEYVDDGAGGFMKVRSYTPDMYSLVERKNISVYGSFLGESDVERMRTQQNVLNCLARKMLKKNLGGGTVISLPDEAELSVEDTDGGDIRVIRPRDAASASLIRTFTLEGDISADMALYQEAYEEARQISGVTDAMQGRRDTTATSAIAKQFSAAQSQGRFESKRVMKKAAWARIYELIFKQKLAYDLAPRPIPVRSDTGEISFEQFDRRDFICRDSEGELYFNDAFLFSCDDDAPVGRDRSAMWKEASENLMRGAYGDPRSDEALLLFWSVLEAFHYPSAGYVREAILERMEKKSAQAEQAAAQAAEGDGEGMPAQPVAGLYVPNGLANA